LKYGRLTLIIIRAKIKEINARKKDSVRNCNISIPLVDPPTFLMPTSLARRDAWAVDRFMKLIAAIITMNIANVARIFRYFGFPAGLNCCSIEGSR